MARKPLICPREGRQIARLGLISSQAFSIRNFRGPLVRDLVERGVRVFALAPDYDAATRAQVRGLGAEPVDIHMARAGLNPISDTWALISLVLRLRSLRLDATLSYFVKPVIYGTLAASLAGVAHRFCIIEGAGYVFTESPGQSQRRGWLRRYITWLYRLALARAEQIFFLNRDDLRLFETAGMVREHTGTLLGGIGLDLSEWTPAPAVTDPVVFVLTARMLREKGIHDYVLAARMVRARAPQTRFLLVGGVDPNPSSLSPEEIRAWVEEGLIEWAGRVDDVKPWLAMASVFVLPSYYREGVPRSIQEAMAMGRAVITTDSVGCRETVEQGVNGFLVPPRSPQELAASMLRFVDSPELVVTMGKASRQLAEQRFDVRSANGLLMREMGIHD